METLIWAGEAHGIAPALSGTPGWVLCRDGRVVASGHGPPPGTPDVLVEDQVLAPGFVDAQVNGAYGVDFAEADDTDLERITRRLPETGATAIVPTFITAPVDELAATLERYRRVWSSSTDSGRTRLLPCHVEGPFIAAARRGAHREECLVDPTSSAVERLVAAGGPALGYVTLAPERVGAADAIARLVGAGVRVSVGHSDADAATVQDAADRGATLVTHLYNAQSPLHHRDPGVVGAALADDRLVLGLIADGHHVAPEAVRLAFSAARGRVMLVTDAVSALGMPPGEYVLGGVALTVTPEGPPLRADGAIAGAAVGMDEVVGHAVRSGVGVAEAIEAATAVPARALGEAHLGHLRPGAAADVVLLGARDLRVRRTWIAGVLAWEGHASALD